MRDDDDVEGGVVDRLSESPSRSETFAVLFTNLQKSWAKRTVALKAFERTLADANDGSESLESTCASLRDDVTPDRGGIFVGGVEETKRELDVAPRRKLLESAEVRSPSVKQRRISFGIATDESDEDMHTDEDAEDDLRALLGRVVEESMSLRCRRIEKEAERRKAVDSARERRDAAKTLVRAVRRWHRSRVNRIRVVQSLCRRWLCKRRVHTLRCQRTRTSLRFRRWRNVWYEMRRERACTLVQAAWRGYKTRCMLREDTERRNRVRKRVEEIVRQYIVRHEHSRRACGAVKIQRAWRAWSRAWRIERRLSAATHIQRIWRGFRARQALRRYIDDSTKLFDRDAALESADESDFMDDDGEVLTHVFSSIRSSLKVNAPITPEKTPTPSADASRDVRRGRDSDAAREHYMRRRRRFLIEQKRRKLREKLQTDSAHRLARFHSAAARSR